MVKITLTIVMVTEANDRMRFDSAYVVYRLNKFKKVYRHTDGAARNSFHCVHIFSDDASQRVNTCIFTKN